jgi:hypothetical protein
VAPTAIDVENVTLMNDAFGQNPDEHDGRAVKSFRPIA